MKKTVILILALIAVCSCRPSVVVDKALPPIFPDYIGVTVPSDIAPLDFNLSDEYDRVLVKVQGADGSILNVSGKYADFPIRKWHRLLASNVGERLTFTVAGRSRGGWKQFSPFIVNVSKYPLDAYGVVYRKIAPGYETYSKIGNYQRDIHTFREDPIIESTLTPGQCVNCHTANATNPDQFTFHLRGKHGTTYFQIGDSHKMVTTKTDKTISNAVYPYWHPSGDYCACSNNSIHQLFWTGAGRQIEVFDTKSDVSVVDVRSDEVITSPLVHTDWFETYPAFSPDGRTLYYCTSYPYQVPANADQLRYDICTIDFDPESGNFGTQVDTLLNVSSVGRSATFPRPSYDGKWLLYTEADFGCFPIDHREADLWIMDLNTSERWPLTEANSKYAESFHNWSADSHWILFSSRRGDGLYSWLYIAQIDDQGRASKAFLLPQKNPAKFYKQSLYSYNVPDFTLRKVKFDTHPIYREVMSDVRVQATDKITGNEEIVETDNGPDSAGLDRFMQ